MQVTDFICGWEQIKQCTAVMFPLVLENLVELNNRTMIYYLEITKRRKIMTVLNYQFFLLS